MKEKLAARSGGLFGGAKQLILVSMILILGLWGMAFLSGRFYGAAFRQAAAQAAQERTALLARGLETSLRSYILPARLLGAAMEGVLESRGTELTEALASQIPGLQDAWLVERRDGTLAAASAAGYSRLTHALETPEASQILASYGAAFEPCFAGATTLANLSPAFGRPVLALGIPYIMKNDGEAESIMVLILADSGFSDLLNSKEAGASYLVDNHGTLLAHPDQALTLAGPSFRDDPLVKAGMTATTGIEQMRLTGEHGLPVTGTYRRILDGRAALVTQAPSAGVLETGARRSTLLLGLMILSAALLALFSLAKVFTTGIRDGRLNNLGKTP